MESSAPLILPIQGHWTFKREIFRVGGSCNFPVLCAHILLFFRLTWSRFWITIFKPLFTVWIFIRAIPYWKRPQTGGSYYSIPIPSLSEILALLVEQNKIIKGIFVHNKGHKCPNMLMASRLLLMVHIILYLLLLIH